MDKKSLEKIAVEVERENSLFANKAFLDIFSAPLKIIGREDKAKELARFLMGYKKGLVVPFISVYGRSGSGKSTVVKFVCENLSGDISFIFVNLRKAKTVFGCANLILAEFEQPSLKSAQGINVAIEKISGNIETIFREIRKTKLFVLVLDEFDVLFNDKRGKPSDFVYKLLVMEEKLREKGCLASIAAISNNVMADYELDDRVKSRIGSSEVFFNAYSKGDVLGILQDRAAKAFNDPIDEDVLEYCAQLSSEEHGDARRAIDLLRVSGEIAGSNGERTITKKHVDTASERLQKDRIGTVLLDASYHLKLVCCALVRITYLSGEVWHSTSLIYKQYLIMVSKYSGKETKSLTYRRVSELLTELENTGIIISQTLSKGRHGYGTQYKLTLSPEIVGPICSANWWNDLVQKKKVHDLEEGKRRLEQITRKSHPERKEMMPGLRAMVEQQEDEDWKEFAGFE